METTITPLVCSLSSTKGKHSLNARTKTASMAGRGARLQATMTRIRNGGTVKRTKRPRTVRTFTKAVRNGQLTGSVSPARPSCAPSAREAVASAPSVEMAEETRAVFRFSIKIRSFTTV